MAHFSDGISDSSYTNLNKGLELPAADMAPASKNGVVAKVVGAVKVDKWCYASCVDGAAAMVAMVAGVVLENVILIMVVRQHQKKGNSG